MLGFIQVKQLFDDKDPLKISIKLVIFPKINILHAIRNYF